MGSDSTLLLMWNSGQRLLAGAAAGTVAVLLAVPSTVVARADVVDGVPEPVLSHVGLTNPAIHAIGAEHTGVPKKTKLELTLSVPAMVRVRVKDLNPYGLRRAFNRDLPAGASAVAIIARVDGTKLPPGKYEVVVKAHNSAGSSKKVFLRLRIVGAH